MKKYELSYQTDANNQCRWNIKHGNGKIVAAASEGFSSYSKAKANLKRIAAALAALAKRDPGLKGRQAWKQGLVIVAGLCAVLLTGCKFDAATSVPGVSWKHAEITVGTNGQTHCVIDGYNSKKDIALTVDPVTHAATLGAVMNPANTHEAGIANVNSITATGDAAVKITDALANGAGKVGGTVLKSSVTPGL